MAGQNVKNVKVFMKKQLYIKLLLLMTTGSALAMVYDNRWLPELGWRPLMKKKGARGQLMLQPVFWIAESANDDDQGQETGRPPSDDGLPLFAINGNYNQITLNRALTTAGIAASTFRSDLEGSGGSLNWFMNGIIRAQALNVTYFQNLLPHLSWGCNFFFARVKSALTLTANPPDFSRFSPGQKQELLEENNTIQDILGLSPRVATVTGISDIELYIRCGAVADYKYKMRHVDVGINLGMLIPSALPINYNNPASIPLGGNGHWGMFVAADGQFELKDNFACGVMLRLNKRFSKTTNRRMIQLTEPQNYGVLYGKSEVDPGLTTIFSPYVQVAEIRSGFGLQLQYYLVYHSPDIWYDRRRTVQRFANTDLTERRSEWGSEYVSVSALYDFAKDSKERSMKPIVSVAIDIPVQFLVAKRSAKTYGISLMVESTLW